MSEVSNNKEHEFSDDQNSTDLDSILDVPLTITVELGRTEVTLHEIMQLGSGSVIEIDKLAGEPLEVFVNSQLAASGEVVVINERYGIRMTDIISCEDKIEESDHSS